MIFRETKLSGAFVIDLEKKEDERGFFARTYCDKEFAEHGLNTSWVQGNASYNIHKNTLRGLHFQAAPYEEIKLVRCIAGALWDVILDIRPDSPTYLQWVGMELTSENRRMFYIPGGFAHGFQTLADSTELYYQMSEYYHPECAGGLRWNDPHLGITWPDGDPRLINQRDQQFCLLGKDE